jgi:predicted RND superfamily exporter protein
VMSIAVVLGVVTLRRERRIAMFPLSILIVATAVTCGAMAWAGSTRGHVRIIR